LDYSQLIALAQVILIDIVLAGDNAVVVGMAAARAIRVCAPR
jgi:predicted tellurium resistance membrane protein TerC